MSDVIDRKPPDIVDGAPPELPPYLQRRRRPNRIRIIPAITHGHLQTRTTDDERNAWTIHYNWMVRIDLETGFSEGPVHVNTREYRRWLETYETETGVPPHISFGGAVVAGEPDPEFHSKWVAYAKRTFVC